MSTRLWTRALFGAVLLTAASLASPAVAQDEPGGLQVTTDYPAVTVQAGDTVTLDLKVHAPDRREVTLDVTDAPEGWVTTLRGGGFVIDGVTTTPDSPPRVELEIVVPPDAGAEVHRVRLTARGGGESDDLDLSMRVTDRPIGGIVLTTDFASLRGRPSDTFRYDLQITNQTPQEETFAFVGTGPPGWTVTAGPASEQRASTVTVAPGDSESVRVEADPASITPAGTYEIVVTATGGGQTGSFTLTAEVTGQPSIEVVPIDGRLDLSGNAGDVAETTLVVVNDGSAPLEDVQLLADEPSEWTVEFEPEQLDSVSAGESEEVTVRIQPAGNAVAGDYAVGVTARAGGESAEIAYRFAVETSRWWGAVGIAVIVAAFVVLLVVFRRFGRR